MSNYSRATLGQEEVLAIIPKISGTLSMLGSGFIIYDVIRDRSKWRKPFYRILLAMSLCDCIVSFWYFLSTWPIPRGSELVCWAVGTRASCNVQGFFIQFGIAVPCYNCSLSVLYVMMIRYNYSDAKLSRNVEPYMHAVALLFALSTASAAIPLDLYSNAYFVCWMTEYPIGCRDDNSCIRGMNALSFRRYMFGVPLALMLFVASCCMGLVYWTVRRQEKRNRKYAFARSSCALQKSKVAAYQGLWFLVPFYITWTPLLLLVILDGHDFRGFWLILCIALFQPCQGFFNYIVYKRRRLISNARNQWKGFSSSLRMSLTSRRQSQAALVVKDSELMEKTDQRDIDEVRSHPHEYNGVLVGGKAEKSNLDLAEEGFGSDSDEIDNALYAENSVAECPKDTSVRDVP